jgi:beta-glucan synthesis-associated protein KRE6
MSSNSNSSSPSPPKVPPHIRLNSAQEDLLMNDPSGQGASRSLIPSRPSQVPQRSHLSQNQIYSDTQVQDSSERLLPPQRSRIRGEESPSDLPGLSKFSSRRSSWDSERSRDSRVLENPFADSRSPSRSGSRADSDDENVNTQTVSERYNILPSAELLLYPTDVEKDDYLHNPDPKGKDERDCDIWTARGIVNVGGLALITLGILTLFIGYPVL